MLETIVMLIHFILIVFIVVTPFLGGIPVLIIHISSVISILIHWVCNNDTCFLTILETYLRGIENKESFTHRIVSPVYKFSEDDISNISYVALSGLGVLSILRLYRKMQDIKKKRVTFNEALNEVYEV